MSSSPEMGMGEWLAAGLPLVLLGAVLGLDVVSFPQAMVSRPLVAATLAGALAGQPVAGLVTGALLECFALETLPVGASRYPEWGSASVVAGAMAARLADHPGGLVLTTVLGLGLAWVGGETMVWHRHLIARWARPRLGALAAGSARTIAGLQLFGLAADLVRGGGVTALGLGLVAAVTAVITPARWTDGALTDASVVGLAGAVAAYAAWKVFHGFTWARPAVLGGLVLGAALVLARG
jgi:PTS system mannose-specific IIC component